MAPRCLPSSTECRLNRRRPRTTRPTNSRQASRTSSMPTESAATVRSTQVSASQPFVQFLVGLLSVITSLSVNRSNTPFLFGEGLPSERAFPPSASSLLLLVEFLSFFHVCLRHPSSVSSAIHHHHLPLPIRRHVRGPGPWDAHDLRRSVPRVEREQAHGAEE